jgi:hypothetical protein
MQELSSSWNFWLFAGVLLISSLVFALWRNHRRATARDFAIQNFLDNADILEKDLQDCRQRMRNFATFLADLPGEDSRVVSSTLSQDTSVNTALKRVLSQRLWLRDHHDSATVPELQEASANLSRSRAALAEHMQKLQLMRDELERATSQLGDAQRTTDKMKNVIIAGISHTIH